MARLVENFEKTKIFSNWAKIPKKSECFCSWKL